MQTKPSAPEANDNSERMAALQTAAAEAFPDIFDPSAPKPLAVGVHRQLKAALDDISMTQIRAFLRHWTRRPAYLQALASSVERVDLQAKTTESIDPDHQRQAREILEKRQQAARPKPRPRGPARSSARPGRGPGRPSASAAPTPRLRQGATPAKPPVIVVKKRRQIAPH